jgi:DNA-binding NarL/FixJ family response regulator
MFAPVPPSDRAIKSPVEAELSAPVRRVPSPNGSLSPTAGNAASGEERLFARRYHFPPSGDTDNDWAVRIDHCGTGNWFPLKTSDRKAAGRKAARIHETVLKHGWEAACRQFSRELIVSVEWCSNPLLWTYTTIHTLVRAGTNTQAGSARTPDARQVIILEQDPGIRRALQWCVSQHPQFDVLACSSPEGYLRASASHPPALVLLNRSLAERVGFDLSGGLTALKPGVLALGYSVSVDGDQMFVSTPGGATGYLLKRVPPSSLLEPFVSAGRPTSPGRDHFLDAAKAAFKELLRPCTGANARPLPHLTPRENEVLTLLSKGCADKEIAQALGLSVWTVHGHIKKIFERLRVRTRTEAVVRYLEK